MNDKEQNIIDLAKYIAGDTKPGEWRVYPFPLPYKVVMKLSAAGHLRVMIDKDLAVRFVKNKNFPKPERMAYKFWNWTAIAVVVIALSIADITQNMYWGLGAFLSPIIWINNKKSAVDFVVELGGKDEEFYDVVAAVEGWRFITTLSFQEINNLIGDWLSPEK